MVSRMKVISSAEDEGITFIDQYEYLTTFY